MVIKTYCIENIKMKQQFKRAERTIFHKKNTTGMEIMLPQTPLTSAFCDLRTCLILSKDPVLSSYVMTMSNPEVAMG